MLRSFLIYLSQAGWAQRMVTGWSFAWNVASRFVAGETNEEAMAVVRKLNAKGINATLDQLGEHTSMAEEAVQSTEQILGILDAIEEADVRAGVSIKLTQIGMGLDSTICRQNLRRILERAQEYKNFVRIDIEDTPYTDITIEAYNAMLANDYSPETVGMAVQSYLYRAEEDTRKMLEDRTRFRLIKGAYKEPPDLAYPKKEDVDANFDLLTKILMDAALAAGSPKVSEDGRIPPIPAIATQDDKRVDFAKQYAKKIELDKEAFEFQMLYGIRRDLQNQLIEEGYQVRVYVPFGTQWYPYFMRRLAERPANLWFFISNFFKK
ncbi:MAG: proline dehydrogenase [Anaerolineae bacterium]|jgi:proline dehydrogenase|nr:proline dehydrogenase [Anaerolineae bacterium]MBT4310756.1 proline dehydrogenase [Anaerolineae bacterium]MBT4458246.1 proline dehydrogenase [Anaerolineae bacterium]MBT4840999.1 proline dehydrogenase [Anaerolineae bacterium]MBT6061127.1 proline dehydrogenase [Anaerolineae bacterium]